MVVVKIDQIVGESISEMTIDDIIDIKGEDYLLIDVKNNYESHRWAETSQFVLRRDSDGKLFHMLYDFGSTEEQENGFYYNNPELVEVEQELIETYVYRVKQ